MADFPNKVKLLERKWEHRLKNLFSDYLIRWFLIKKQ